MKSIAIVSSFAVVVKAALDVQIEAVGNTEFIASITNSGDSDIKVLRTGSILDDVDVERSEVTVEGTKLPFDGVRLSVDISALSEDNFQIISVGETIEVAWDAAIGHDLSRGGEFDFRTTGLLAYAEINSTTIAGHMEYDSNVIHSTVDGEAAALVRRDFQENLHKRFAVQSDCAGSQRTNTINAISNCRSLAQRAASVASSGSAAKMNEFFKSSTSATRNTVASTFNRIASQCSSSSSGAPQYCSDIHPSRPCSQNGVIAYCAGGSYVVNCPYYFSFPNHNTGCRSITQSSTTLHEATHLSSVKGTVDYCYGYSCIQSLSSSQNLNNADTYTLFAQSIHAGC